MSVSLVTTKLFFPPARDKLIPRARLMERLSIGLRGPLTLLSAPAGYGKTSLLSEWRAGIGHDLPAAWISLDSGDGDLALFLSYLTAALESVQAGLVGNTLGLLQSPQPSPPEAVLASLVNDLATFPGDFILVLDDYHAITTVAIHDAIAFLLAHAPPQMHLAILTREDPPLPLSKLRARGQMVEIREADLRFSPEEAAAFLTQTMGLTLSENAISSLAERTEGWIAGLQMAGLSLREGRGAEEFVAAFRGEDRYVMDYLMDEVFRRQSEEVQDFLLHASILERLCGPLCDALLEVGGLEPASTSSSLPRGTAQASQEILEHLEHANLFILPLDNRREWYRLHSLFADLLRSRLQRLHPERVPELHRRACHWHVQAGNPDEAMKHALAAADPELAADVAEQFLLQMTGSSRLSTYLVWLRNLPEEVICRRAYLCAGCGWAYVLTHQADLAERYVQCGETALPHFEPVYSIPDRLWISGEQVRGSLPAIRSYSDRLRGNLPRAIKHAHEALEALPPEALAVRCAVALNLGMLQFDIGDLEMARRAFDEAFETAEKSGRNVYVAVTALSLLGGILVAQGKLREAEAILHRAVRFGTEESKATVPLPGVGVIHCWLVEIHSQRNEIAAAQEHLDIVLRSVGPMGIPDTTIRAYLYQALLAQSRGEFSAAEGWLQRAEQLIERGPVEDLVRTEWIAFRGQFHLAQGDWASASKLLAAQGVQATDLEEQPSPGSTRARSLGLRLARYLVLARVLLACGALDQAARLLERVCSLAEDCPDFAAWLEALALQAVVAARSRGDAGRALPVLERALDLAAPEGYVRPFLNAGEPLMALLRKAITLGIQPAFAHTLHGELAGQERHRIGARAGRLPGGSESAAGLQMPEPLTEREQQILRLLAAGLSSTEIAQQLVIAVNTARSYIKSIYGKLDAHSRDEAIEKGKQAGLI